ncbi:MAG: deoxyhypusine synthase family protein [Nitrospirae bacterium]|nr:deoxyhypusine synthase family protein [Nitrospirota bacterium]
MTIVKPLETTEIYDESIKEIARSIIKAKRTKSQIIMMMGGHVIRSGVQRYIIDLMKKGYISCLSINGACMIHDYEFALIGATTESVSKYIRDGQFGLWQETARINDIINKAYKDEQIGMGEAISRAIYTEDFPYKEISLLSTAYMLNIPVTIHIGIGYDIINEHPNFDGAASGALSYMDFLVLARIISMLEGGVVMSFGSAVMAPEVFLKALSMARNVAHQSGKAIRDFTTLVCDLHTLPEDFSKEPPKNDPDYFFRPWKTMLVRTVSDGGRSFYVKGQHSDTIPAIWSAIASERHS